MSTSNKIIILLVLIAALLGGWFYMNKSADTTLETPDVVSSEVQDPNAMVAPEVEAQPQLAEVGTVTVMPIDPILGQRGVGDPNAPIKIKEYFSLTCNHCADFHKTTYQELKAKYIDTGKVYFIYEEFPLNGPALYGSMIARCLPEDRYPAFVDLLLRNQETWAFGSDFKASLLQNAKLAGMSDEEFETCFNNKDLQKAIANNISAASDAYKISSTPSFVANDGERLIRGGKSIADFSAVIDELLAASGANATNVQSIAPIPMIEENAPDALAPEVLGAEGTPEEMPLGSVISPEVTAPVEPTIVEPTIPSDLTTPVEPITPSLPTVVVPTPAIDSGITPTSEEFESPAE